MTIHRTRRLHLLLVVAFLFMLLSVASARSVAAQDVPIVYEHLDTEMTLNEDGTLHVRVIQQIRFDGRFSQAFYAIPLENLSSVSNVKLYGAATESDNYELNTPDLAPILPNFIDNNGSEIVIDWNYPQTERGDVRLFVIEYDVLGVVWVYPDRDFISWKAVGEDRSGITVNRSEVSLTLPDLIPIEQVTTTDSLGGNISVVGNTITFEADRPIPDGTPYVVEASFPHGILDLGVREWQRIYDGDHLQVEINRFHVDLTINTDGTIHAQENTVLTVTDGALHQGVRSLKLLYLDEISEPSVVINNSPLVPAQGDCTGCFEINALPRPDRWVYLNPTTEQLTIHEDNSGLYNIDWYAPLPILAGEQLTTTISYVVTGALRTGDENQLLTWQVVPDFGLPVRQASMRLVLPPGLSAEQIQMEAPAEQGAPQTLEDGSLLYRFDGPVVPGAWQIVVTLPPNATRGPKPQWQAQFEEVMAQADAAVIAHARNTLIRRILGILAIIGALLAAVLWWFRWGRRKVKETLGGYVSEPPSPQSPAIVGYLVDRKATERGILGTIFYLASLRVLEVDLKDNIKLRRLRDEPLQGTSRLADVYGENIPVPRHVQALFDQVLLPSLPHNEWATVNSITPLLRAKLPDIYALLAADLQKYFINIPGGGSDTIPGGLWLTIYGTLMALMFFEIIPWYLGFFIGFVTLLGFVAWSALYQTGRGGYSDAGALEAEKWRRFKTYLLEIKKYGDQGAAQEILDRYFGYAVALGVEDVVLAQAALLETAQPAWMPGSGSYQRPSQRPRPQTGSTFPWSRPRPRPAPTSEAPQPRPTLAGMSAGLGDSIRRASRDLGALLSTAAGDANAASRSVVLNSQLRRREMEWKPNTPVTTILDDILRQSVSDAREVQAREIARREAARRQTASSSSGGSWGGGGGSSSRSSSSFGRSSSSFGGSSRSGSSSRSSSSSASSSSRSSGGGRSGFR